MYPKQRLGFKPDSAISVFVNTTMIKSINFLRHPFLLRICLLLFFFYFLIVIYKSLSQKLEINISGLKMRTDSFIMAQIACINVCKTIARLATIARLSASAYRLEDFISSISLALKCLRTSKKSTGEII